MESVDQEFRLAKEQYAGMTEDEIGALAAEAYDLTEIAREALAATIAERRFKIQLAEAPPPKEPKGVGDSKDQLDLSIVCELKSEADARRAKAILDANHIASCLGPENIADLENFRGSFAGKVDLKAFPEDAVYARKLLEKYAPDLMEWEDDPDPREELDYAVTCPKCQSEDIVLDETHARPEGEKFPYIYLWTCAACGHQWRDEGYVHVVNDKARGQSSSSD